MIGRIVSALLALVVTAPLAVAQTPRVLLKPGEVLTGRFTQQLERADVPTAADGGGSFTLAIDQGLIWRLERPVAATIAITPAAFVQWVDGREVQHIPASKAPVLGDLYRLLAASLGGDWSALAQEFVLDEHDQGPDWTLVLEPHPTDEMMASQLRSVTVSGDRFIRVVVIRRANGDVQTTRFSDLSLATGSVPTEDQGLLAAARQ